MNKTYKTFAIVANPVAGSMPLDKKHNILKTLSKIIGAQVFGLDTRDKTEFRECIKSVSRRYDVIIAAGGDGTFSDLINSIDLTRNIAGYLPMGSGNALRYALGYPFSLVRCALKLRYGSVKKIDLIRYEDRYLFMGSIGFEVEVLSNKRKNSSYLHATLSALKNYKKKPIKISARICLEEREIFVKDALSILVTKQPYYGYGMKVMPQARFDDGLLHIGIFPSGVLNLIVMMLLSLSVGNVKGRHIMCEKAVFLDLFHFYKVQMDGDIVFNKDRLKFNLAKKVLSILS
jgi:diacylglycerol kinase family enzyme